MKLLLLHGPNLNLLGRRPGDAPGLTSEVVERAVREEAAAQGAAEVRFVQGNHEGVLLDALHAAEGWATGVVLNAGVLGHTSWALREAVASVRVPVVEVELDVPAAGEPWRQVAVLEGVAAARICERGLQGYLDAVRWLAARGAEAGRASAGTVHGDVTVGPAGAGASLAAPIGEAMRGGTGSGPAAAAASALPVEAGARTTQERDPAEWFAGSAPTRTRDLQAITSSGPLPTQPPASAGRKTLGPVPESRPMPAAVIQPARPSTSARECAFCADEPCELHGGAPVTPTRTGGVGLGLASEAMVRLRALETDALVAETSQSIAALQGSAATAEQRSEHVLAHGRAGTPVVAPAPALNRPEPSGGDVTAPPVRKSIGPSPGASAPAAPRKTLGRARPAPDSQTGQVDGAAPLRSQLADKVAAHLAGALPASELAAFARAGWMALDAGGPLLASDRDRLEPALRQLMFQDTRGSALDAPSLVSLLASLQ